MSKLGKILKKEDIMPFNYYEKEFQEKWDCFWENIMFVEQPINDERIEIYIKLLKHNFVNGEVLIKKISYEKNLFLDRFINERAKSIHETPFFIRFFENENIRRIFSDLHIPKRLTYIPDLKIMDGITSKYSFLKDQLFMPLLCNGGAYYSFEGPKEVADKVCRQIYESIFENRLNDFVVFSFLGYWNEWFFDVAWDYTYVIFDKKENLIWVLAITDTD
jgi:hypothetical protein